MNAMRLIWIMCLLSFCGCLDENVIPELSEPVKRIIRSSWNKTEFNPDIMLSTPQIIKRAGYPTETHVVTTEDGYLLTLHRIPGGNGSLPVLLLNGIFCTSVVWVTLGKDKALAYLLADQGYDVWLGNFRGNAYSRAHISLSPSEWKFWDYSFHEIGVYDLPAMITFITNMRSQPLHAYIGHSMGESVFYVMAIERPKFAEMVKMMISFGPGVFLDHMKSPLRPMFYIATKLQSILRVLFHDEVLPRKVFKTAMALIGCDPNFLLSEICAHIFIFSTFGYDSEHFNYAQLPVIVGHIPVSLSTKTVAHLTQGIQSGKFRRYDYGATKNLLIYNSIEPPDYDLSSVRVPIAIFYANNDLLVDPIDVKRLYNLLPNVIDLYEVPRPSFNHVGFIWADDAPSLVYERVFKIMKGKYSNNVTTIIH